MRLYVNGTYPFVITVLIALMASYAYCANQNSIPMPIDTREQKIGEKGVSLIKNKLKNSALTLLASSEFTTARQMQRRIQDLEDTLNSFKADMAELIGPFPSSQQSASTVPPAIQVPIAPAPVVSAPVTNPAPIPEPVVPPVAPPAPIVPEPVVVPPTPTPEAVAPVPAPDTAAPPVPTPAPETPAPVAPTP